MVAERKDDPFRSGVDPEPKPCHIAPSSARRIDVENALEDVDPVQLVLRRVNICKPNSVLRCGNIHPTSRTPDVPLANADLLVRLYRQYAFNGHKS